MGLMENITIVILILHRIGLSNSFLWGAVSARLGSLAVLFYCFYKYIIIMFSTNESGDYCYTEEYGNYWFIAYVYRLTMLFENVKQRNTATNPPSVCDVIHSQSLYALQFLIHSAFVLVFICGRTASKNNLCAHFPLLTLWTTLNNVV